MKVMKKWLCIVIACLILLPTTLQAQATTSPIEQTTSITWEQALTTTNDYILGKNPNPTFNSEWNIFSLARSNHKVPKDYYEKYYSNVVTHVKSVNGVLDRRKYTEYSRTIIALTAIGKDPRNVGDYNLVEKLYDFDQVIWQGINGPIFALIALDTWKFQLPETWDFGVEGKTLTTRNRLIRFILDQEITDAKGVKGGFALSGKNPDTDITAMAIQALSGYQQQPEVAAAIDRALIVLEKNQLPTGGYSSWGMANVESAAQVIVALTSVGIDPAQDMRFTKVMPNILTFYNVADGGFKHIATQTVADGMATEQASYTLTAYKRFQQKQHKLYDMSDTQKDYTTFWKSLFPTYEQLTKDIQLSVPVNHTFTVNFNQAIQVESNMEGKVTMWDAEANVQVPSQISQGEIEKSLKVKAITSLQSNHYYYLVIHEGTIGTSGKALKPGIVHVFKTQ